MAIIGTFKLGADGIYSGEITTLTVNQKIRLLPTNATAKNAPDLRVTMGLSEIGVGWQKTSRSGDPYFSIKIDDPSFAAPVWANLVESKKEVAAHSLLWDRPSPRNGKAS